MGASKGKKGKANGRDVGPFTALPMIVTGCVAYIGLSFSAKALLIEVARQFRGNDNGRLILTEKHLKPRGWNSNDTITRAKRELLAAGFIYETKKGQRPHVASWYACTWWALDKLDGYDEGAAAGFVRGAYLKGDTIALLQPVKPKTTVKPAPEKLKPLLRLSV
jgi:hypothetical protein